jgi:Ca-activated chloride channel family protein
MHIMQQLRALRALSGIMALAFLSSWAQSQAVESTNADSIATFKTSVNLVLVDAMVRDHKGRLQSNLSKANFHIFEDGVEQPLRYFSEAELPLAIALVLDKSGSMRIVFQELRTSAAEILNVLKPHDRVALFTFDREVQRLTDLTTDRQQIAQALDSLEAGGGTDILDALYEAGRYLALSAPKDRKAIVLISDNISSQMMSRIGADELIRRAQQFETDIHSVQVRQLIFQIALLPSAGFHLLDMSHIAKETGGELSKSSAGGLDKTLTEVLDRIRRRYTIGYYANPTSQPGQYHRLEVRLVDDKGKPFKDYSISARRGYYTPR